MEPDRAGARETPSGLSPFQVTIWYREPTYELVNGPKDDPYFWTQIVFAVDPEHACRLALREFEQMARLSNVGWIRKILRVDTEVLRKAS
jgi:hypothetical protein